LGAFLVLAASSFGARGLVIGASALMHVAIFAVAGHARSASTDDPLELIDVTTIPVADTTIDVKPDPLANDAETHLHFHSHTHPYPVSPDHDATPHDPSIIHTPFSPHAATPHSDAPPAPADAPSNIETAPAAATLPSFTISIGASTSAHGTVQTNAAGNGSQGDHDDAPVPESGVSQPAHLVRSVLPAYPADARSEEIEADVPLEIVVDKAGTVVSARSLAPAGYGFDEAALSAIRQYRFSPAGRGGHAVAVRMPWTVQFRLK
jgi:protein TonB